MSSYDKKRKRILKRACVGLTLFVLTFTLLSLVSLFFGESSMLSGENPLVWISLTTFLAAVGYPPIERLYAWLFRHVLFPRRHHFFVLLNKLVQEIQATSDLSELANLLVNTLGEVLQFKTVSVLIRSRRGEGYVIASAYGWSVTNYRKLKIEAGNPFLELLKVAGSEVILQEKAIQSLTWQEANQLTGSFELLHATCIIPLWVKSELVGSINLYIPASDPPLDEGDLRALRDFGREVAPCVRAVVLIQELKDLNEELRDTQSQLLQNAKVTAIEQLASGIAHEIHNPLTIISGKAQVLLLQKDRKIYDEKVEEVLRTIVKQTRRAADITRKLTLFSRSSASPKERIRLQNVLEDTLSLIAYQTSLEGIEIKRLVSEELPDFLGNLQELREIFLNLILNALQATGPGGKIQVGVTYHKADEVVMIQVADNGPGIPAEYRDKVFNPFFTTRSEAVGLGLFVTQQIVNRSGGSIRVESEHGEGTLFVIELPLEVAPPDSGAISVNTNTENGGEIFTDTAPRNN